MNYEGVTCNQAVLLCAFPEKKNSWLQVNEGVVVVAFKKMESDMT